MTLAERYWEIMESQVFIPLVEEDFREVYRDIVDLETAHARLLEASYTAAEMLRTWLLHPESPTMSPIRETLEWLDSALKGMIPSEK